MMITFVLGFVVLSLAMLGMAAGVLLGRRPLRGSCGGLSSEACAGCRRACAKRRAAAADDARQED